MAFKQTDAGQNSSKKKYEGASDPTAHTPKGVPNYLKPVWFPESGLTTFRLPPWQRRFRDKRHCVLVVVRTASHLCMIWRCRKWRINQRRKF